MHFIKLLLKKTILPHQSFKKGNFLVTFYALKNASNYSFIQSLSTWALILFLDFEGNL